MDKPLEDLATAFQAIQIKRPFDQCQGKTVPPLGIPAAAEFLTSYGGGSASNDILMGNQRKQTKYPFERWEAQPGFQDRPLHFVQGLHGPRVIS